MSAGLSCRGSKRSKPSKLGRRPCLCFVSALRLAWADGVLQPTSIIDFEAVPAGVGQRERFEPPPSRADLIRLRGDARPTDSMGTDPSGRARAVSRMAGPPTTATRSEQQSRTSPGGGGRSGVEKFTAGRRQGAARLRLGRGGEPIRTYPLRDRLQLAPRRASATSMAARQLDRTGPEEETAPAFVVVILRWAA